jgi:hypothetical protein
MTIEELIAKAFVASHIRSKTWGFSFDPRDAYIKAYYCQRSLYCLKGNEDYQQAKDTKMLRAYLGLKDQQDIAMKAQLTPSEIRLNRVLG